MIRVLIADDQALVRGGLRLILEAQPDLEVVGEAQDGREAVQQCRTLHPDVALLDIQMPTMSGIEATAEIARQQLPTHVLILTTFDLDEYVFDAIKAGAAGFLLKDVAPRDLTHAVRTVASGDSLVAPSITRRLLEEFVARPNPALAGRRQFGQLTSREVEVMGLVARGSSNNEIAQALHLSEATIKTHVSRIYTKLELRDRAQLVVAAYEGGLVRPGSPPQSSQ